MKPAAVEGRITAQEKIGSGILLLRLSLPLSFPVPEPGQFLHIRAWEGSDPLLRRPFSVAGFKTRTRDSEATIIYSAAGPGTKILSEKKGGEKIDVLGPLGHGFTIQDCRFHVLVGGGRGIAPLLYLGDVIRKRGGFPVFLHGTREWDGGLFNALFRGRAVRISLREAEKAGLEQVGERKRAVAALVSTENGRQGFKGKVTGLLSAFRDLSVIGRQTAAIYACGPRSMLSEIAGFAMSARIPCQVSLEERFLCGMGICLACSIRAREGKTSVNRRVCADGPVFSADKVDFRQLAASE